MYAEVILQNEGSFQRHGNIRGKNQQREKVGDRQAFPFMLLMGFPGVLHL